MPRMTCGSKVCLPAPYCLLSSSKYSSSEDMHFEMMVYLLEKFMELVFQNDFP